MLGSRDLCGGHRRCSYPDHCGYSNCHCYHCEGTIIITPATATTQTILWLLLLLLLWLLSQLPFLLLALLVVSQGVLNIIDTNTAMSRISMCHTHRNGNASLDQAQMNGKVFPWPKHPC